MSFMRDPGGTLYSTLGTKVSRATAALPQTTSSNIFTITGGRILLTSLVGEVTTAIQAQANNTKIISNPTTGSSVDLCAVKDITGLEVGGFLSLVTEADVTPFGAAFNQQNAGGITIHHLAIIVPVGALELSCAASNTGSIKWDLTYFAYDAGASVAAA